MPLNFQSYSADDPVARMAAIFARQKQQQQAQQPVATGPAAEPPAGLPTGYNPPNPNLTRPTQAGGNFPGGPGLTPNNPNAAWGGGAEPDTRPNQGLAPVIAAREARAAAASAPTATAPGPGPTEAYTPSPVHMGEQVDANATPAQRAAAKLKVLDAYDPSSRVRTTDWGVEAEPPRKPSRLHEALTGALQGAIIGAGQGRGWMGAAGGAAAGTGAGAVSPRLQQALERYQEKQRTQGELEQAQQGELRTAQIRDTAAQAQQRESDAQKVDYTPPGALYPVKVSAKDYAKLTQRDSEDASDPWTTYIPPGATKPIKVRSSVAARLGSADAASTTRIKQQETNETRLEHVLSEQIRHNKEMKQKGDRKEAAASAQRINKLKQAQSQVKQYSTERDKLESDASALEQRAIAEDAKVDDFGLQDPTAKTRAADLRRQADEKRRAAQRSHETVMRAQSVVDAIPETAPAASSKKFAGKTITRANVNVYAQRHNMTPEAAAKYLADEGAKVQ